MNSENNKHYVFSIEYTNYAKGIAIILLLVHHFAFVPYHVPFTSGSIRELIVLLCKVCVPLFSILSGYGLTKSYISYSKNSNSSNKSFVINHLKKLLKNYWWVYIPVLLLSLAFGIKGYPWDVYGTGFLGFINFLLDFSGMRAIAYTPTYCNTWWFIEATIVFYTLFPLLYKAYKKLPIVTLLVLAIPLLYVQFFNRPEFLKSGDRELFYLFSFAFGMMLADRGSLDKSIRFCEKKKTLYFALSIAFLILGVVSSMFVGSIGRMVFALSIIVFVIFMKSIRLNSSKLFEFLGKYSMNVFLIHSLYMSYIKEHVRFDELGAFNYILQFAVVFVSNFAISVALEYIKKYFRTRIKFKRKTLQ